MSTDRKRYEKGVFTRSRLPVAARYLVPDSRGRLFLFGAILAAVLLVPLVLDATMGSARLVSSGPLSSQHTIFGKDCATCHTPVEGPTDQKCESCHEKQGDALGVYSFDRHYLYRSDDYDRSAPSSSELQCASCHVEHEGADAALVDVDEGTCIACHEFGSFDQGHPEFRFAQEQIRDPSNLHFPHIYHVDEVMLDQDFTDLEQACLQCHEPVDDGSGFQSISFEKHCDSCHLSAREATPALPLVNGSGPGVIGLADLLSAPGPAASTWVGYANPAEFAQVGGGLRKQPVYHADPWILENLRRLRAELFPGTELADLLTTSSEVDGADIELLYQEAIANLRSQMLTLRGEPDGSVQRELEALGEALAEAERRLADPLTPFDETRFDVRSTDRSSEELDLDAYREVVDGLTEACQECHLVQDATIRRVQTNQSTLHRADFDHRAHIIHARCVDCHTQIPIADYAGGDEDPPEGTDHSEIQNLPTIATCQSCHSPSGTSDGCTTCHAFHPDKSQWSNLSRFHR